MVSLFSSQASVIELLLEGSDEPLQVTPGHMIFSLDQETWIPAGKLRRGEKLATLDGQVRLLEIRGGGELIVVRNLEVHGSHRYHVGEAAVLVHNMCEEAADAFSKKGGGKNAQHGREPTPSQKKQVEDLERELRDGGLSRREKTKIKKKIDNIKKDMERKRKGENHSRKHKGNR